MHSFWTDGHSLPPLVALLTAVLASGGAAGQDGPARQPATAMPFEDVAPESGLDFVHFNGMTGDYYFPEMTGQGAALFDYDGDGDLDAYLVQGGMLGPGKTLTDALMPPLPGSPPGDRLYRNDLAVDASGRPRARYVDVTDTAGLTALGYGMGVAVGDYDNDGARDLYVTNFVSNQFWRNNGDGSFSDVTDDSGTDDPLWSTSASFFDYDGDGAQDLYVVNYVDYDLAANPVCYAASSRRDYCGPADFGPLPDKLLRNQGDGRFEDVTSRVLLGYRPGPGLGVTAADFNGDRHVDLYVANDGAPNQLWLNRGDGSFIEDAMLAGAAVNRQGRSEASMGLAVTDVEGDGDEDIFVTHLMGESNTLYINDGSGLFEDRSIESGLAAPSLGFTSFGVGWLDYDLDGRQDLLVLSGAVRVLAPLVDRGDPYPIHQPNQLYRNLGDLGFEDVTANAGEVFALSEVSRGVATGDTDNDGSTEVLVANNNGPARLLSNDPGSDPTWVGLRLIEERTGSDAIGARAAVERSDGVRIWRRVHTDGSYCSARDPRLVIGLDRQGADAVSVHWPSGRVTEIRQPPLRRYLVIPGSGIGADRGAGES